MMLQTNLQNSGGRKSEFTGRMHDYLPEPDLVRVSLDGATAFAVDVGRVTAPTMCVENAGKTGNRDCRFESFELLTSGRTEVIDGPAGQSKKAGYLTQNQQGNKESFASKITWAIQSCREDCNHVWIIANTTGMVPQLPLKAESNAAGRAIVSAIYSADIVSAGTAGRAIVSGC
jgi:hypothetical protein